MDHYKNFYYCNENKFCDWFKTGLRFQNKTNNKMLWAYVEIVTSLFLVCNNNFKMAFGCAWRLVNNYTLDERNKNHYVGHQLIAGNSEIRL